MAVRKLLDELGQQVETCCPDDRMLSAAAMLTTRGNDALPVCDENDSLVGVVSERDIVHAIARSGCGLGALRVGNVMSTSTISCGPDASLEEARTLLQRHRMRYLPVVERGQVLGILSIQDLRDKSLETPKPESSVLVDEPIAAQPNVLPFRPAYN